MNNPAATSLSPNNHLEMTPPPMLKLPQSPLKNPSPDKDPQNYIPQILANEQEVLGTHDFKLQETRTMAEEEHKNEVLNESYSKNEENTNNFEDKPKVSSKKQAIKLITVPQEHETLADPNKESSNPQEYESSTLEMKPQNLDISELKQQDLADSKYDSPCLSPNSKLPISRKKSILKGSPNLKLDAQRFDAEGNLISDDKRHRISFRADLYQINEVESYKNVHNGDFWKKCCKFCTIQ